MIHFSIFKELSVNTVKKDKPREQLINTTSMEYLLTLHIC